MQTTTIHLVRHGKVENPEHVIYERLPDYHLSERGERMAEATAQYMAANRHMSDAVALFSSPLDRTMETAAHVRDALNERRAAAEVAGNGEQGETLSLLGITQDERLIEAGNEFRGRRIGYGAGALWRPSNLRLLLRPMKPSWGESYASIAERMTDFAFEKADEFAGKAIIVVSHESPIWTLRTKLVTGKAESNVLKRKTALASVTSLVLEVGTHKLVAVSYMDPAANVE
ncbi:MAG: histidine phosphatase family protein [Bifidobacteriaceae bacterium]|jgi:broad specificity phosphatase PhoE|nr:histidine phosphatase family protein [Bifidobacteriaceae bacterium]